MLGTVGTVLGTVFSRNSLFRTGFHEKRIAQHHDIQALAKTHRTPQNKAVITLNQGVQGSSPWRCTMKRALMIISTRVMIIRAFLWKLLTNSKIHAMF